MLKKVLLPNLVWFILLTAVFYFFVEGKNIINSLKLSVVMIIVFILFDTFKYYKMSRKEAGNTDGNSES